jgi:hypothetical protein
MRGSGGAAWTPLGCDTAGQPPRVGEGAAQQELDLGVSAAQFVRGPPGQGVMNGWVQPQQDALALAHRVTVPAITDSGTGIDDLLGGLLPGRRYRLHLTFLIPRIYRSDIN